MNKFTSSILTLGLLATVAAPLANAAFIINFTEVGSDVVLTYSGSTTVIPSSDGGFSVSLNNDARLNPSNGFVSATIGSGSFSVDAWNFDDGGQFPSFGTDTFTTGATVQAGSTIFGFISSPTGQLYLPDDYVSGSSVGGSATFANASLVSLGITPGTYGTTFGGGADSITLTAAVPEPSSFALIAVMGLGALLRRRR
jgi:hypothetical protein